MNAKKGEQKTRVHFHRQSIVPQFTTKELANIRKAAMKIDPYYAGSPATKIVQVVAIEGARRILEGAE